MTDDGTIRIGTEVDISGIQQGMREAQQAVTASTSRIEAAYKQLATAAIPYSQIIYVARFDTCGPERKKVIPFGDKESRQTPACRRDPCGYRRVFCGCC
jgi:hypothetical protein